MSAKPSAHVSWLVSAALSHVRTSSVDDDVRGLTAPLEEEEEEGTAEASARARASTELSRSSRQSV